MCKSLPFWGLIPANGVWKHPFQPAVPIKWALRIVYRPCPGLCAFPPYSTSVCCGKILAHTPQGFRRDAAPVPSARFSHLLPGRERRQDCPMGVAGRCAGAFCTAFHICCRGGKGGRTARWGWRGAAPAPSARLFASAAGAGCGRASASVVLTLHFIPGSPPRCGAPAVTDGPPRPGAPVSLLFSQNFCVSYCIRAGILLK